MDTYDANITNLGLATDDTTKCGLIWRLRLNTTDQWGNVWINPSPLPCWTIGKCLLIQINNSTDCRYIGFILFKNTPDVYSAPSFRFQLNFANNTLEYYTGDTGLPLTLQKSIPNLSSFYTISSRNLLKICYLSESSVGLTINNKYIGAFTHFSFPMGSVGLYAPCLKQQPYAELR